MTTTMTDLQTGRTFVFNEALPGRDAYEEALAQGFVGDRAAWLAHLRGFAFDPIDPDWAVDREYPINAAVRHDHRLWVCKIKHTGTTPGSDATRWTLLLDGADAQALTDAVDDALAHKSAAETARGGAETARTDAASLLAQTQAASQALSPIDALHPVALPIPDGWWDTRDRLLSGNAERAIISNWQPTSLLPASLWRATLASSVYDAPTGGALADPGDGAGRIEDQSGNGVHLTQATSSLRPVFGRRPETGVRNRMLNSANVALYNANNVTLMTLPAERLGHDMVRVTASAAGGYVNCGTGYPSDLGADVAITVEVRAGTATTAILYAGGAGNNFGATFDTITGAVSGVSSRIKATAAADLGGGWWRLTFVTDDLGSAPAVLVTHGPAPEVVGAYFDVGRVQVEQGSAASDYQRTASNGYDITADGVQSVTYLRFDLVDDKLPSPNLTLSGQALVAGDGGMYITDLSLTNAPFEIGGTHGKWTGAGPGLLRAVTGDTGRVLGAITREGDFSEAEIQRLERFYRARGGKGLLVPTGPELWTGAPYGRLDAGATDLGGGAVEFAGGGAALVGYISGKLTVGHWYVADYTVTRSAGNLAGPYDGAGVHQYVVSASGTYRKAFKAASTGLYVAAPVSGSGTISGISVRRLIPREDL